MPTAILIGSAALAIYLFIRVSYGYHIQRALLDFVYRSSDNWRAREEWLDDQPYDWLLLAVWRDPVAMVKGRYANDFKAYLKD
jgi:hypothetical protein